MELNNTDDKLKDILQRVLIIYKEYKDHIKEEDTEEDQDKSFVMFLIDLMICNFSEDECGCDTESLVKYAFNFYTNVLYNIVQQDKHNFSNYILFINVHSKIDKVLKEILSKFSDEVKNKLKEISN